MAAGLTLYTATSLNAAYELPVSNAEAFFASKSYDDWKQGRDVREKNKAVTAQQLNEIIRGIGVVVQTIARTR